MSKVVVRPVTVRRDQRRFVNLPWRLYREDAHWFPPLRHSQKQMLSYVHHPFHDQADVQTFIAERAGRTVGRIAAIVNRAHNERYQEQRGFFGFFECEDDEDAASALFAAAEDWLRQRGQTAVRGPMNPSLNYEAGLLIDGFDRDPAFMMPHGKPYYPRLVEACGYAKAHDMYAFTGEAHLLPGVTERYLPAVERAINEPRLTIRPLDRRRFEQDVRTYLEIYNSSLTDTWGFVPLSAGEAAHVAKDLRHLIEPRFTAFAEVEGKMVGALFCLLDYNPLIRRIDGRLFPFGFVRLLSGKRKLTNLRIVAMTMTPAYRRSGLALLLLHSIVHQGLAWGLRTAEFSFVMESNTMAAGSLRRGGLEVTRTYRLYDKAL
jgi:GNAT superfamily N-acetyltransferase